VKLNPPSIARRDDTQENTISTEIPRHITVGFLARNLVLKHNEKPLLAWESKCLEAQVLVGQPENESQSSVVSSTSPLARMTDDGQQLS
jgi:hypothetical protein